MFAHIYKSCAFSTYVTHMNLKCEPHVLSPTIVRLYYALFFYFKVWDLRNSGQLSHYMELPLCFVLFCFYLTQKSITKAR